MRVLVSFAGGRGHLLPLLPLARALRDAGHRLVLSGGHRAVAGMAGTGLFDQVLPHDRLGQPPPEPPDGGTGDLDLTPLEVEAERIGSGWAGRMGPRNRVRTAGVLERWPADLVLCDEMDFGSVAAARDAGLPCVVVDVIASGALTRPEHVTGPLADLGLDVVTAKGDLPVVPFPPCLRDPALPLPAGAAVVRPEEPAAPDGPEPDAVGWLRAHDGPRVYLTLGTVFNTGSGDLFARLLRGLAGRGARVLATVGREVDPARVGVSADDVRVERFVPQAQVLPAVDVVVNHGGSGSVVGALAHGVPVVAAPLGADQELNAARLTALGAGLRLDPVTTAGDDVWRAVSSALETGPRAAARQVADEVAALPVVASLVSRVDRLVGSTL
ncbi:glycosyltransferase [Nocardioides marinquilinus]|uniref:glycosyltransferase n=1 Tax=Nocardioides marinquilinus TaxID=1210400 RepID=UPI0031ED9388